MQTTLKIFIRSLLRDKVHSLINLSGLALGFFSFIAIQLYVHYQESYDDFYSPHIYRFHTQKTQGQEVQPWKSSASVNLSNYLTTNFPQVVAATRVNKFNQDRILLEVEHQGTNQLFEEFVGRRADGNFFDIFETPFISGNPTTALTEPYSIVLTARIAKALFGSTQALGKTVRLIEDERTTMKVTGVIEDIPDNTHMPFDYLISLATMQAAHPDWNWRDAWYWDYFHTYAKLAPGTDLERFTERLNEAVASSGAEQFGRMNFSMAFQMLSAQDIHLKSSINNEFANNANGSTIKLLSWISYFILLVAWINYINLTTAKSINRSKEIGVKKTMGALQSSLINQLLIESLLFNLMALILSTLGLIACYPWLATLVPPQVFSIPGKELLLGGFLVIFLLGSIGSSIYPALLTSKLDIVLAVKGAFKTSKEGLVIRKSLVIFQFMLTTVLVVGTLIIYQQMSHLLNRDLGFSPEQILIISEPNDVENYQVSYYSYKHSVLQDSHVEALTSVGKIPGIYNNNLERFRREFENNAEAKPMKFHVVDYDFESVFGLEVLGGRSFDRAMENEETRVVVMNESAIKLLGFSDANEAIGMDLIHLTYGLRELPVKLIGVVNDYNHSAMNTVDPMVFMLDEQVYWRPSHFMCLKVSTRDISNTLSFLQQEYNSFFPGDKFSYWFLDRTYNQAYESHLVFQKVFNLFSILGVIVANLGLIGLSIFTINQSKKELSIRKVLGASVHLLYRQFSLRFVKLVLLGSALGVPMAYFFFDRWLEDYPSRVSIGMSFLILPVVVLVLLALLVISSIIIKAVKSNPIKNLSSE